MLRQVGIRNTFSVEQQRHHHPYCRYYYYCPWAVVVCDSAGDEYKTKVAAVGILA